MSFELNKIAGAILGTLLLVMGLGFLAEAIYAPIENRGPGYSLPEPDGHGGAEVVEVAEATPLPVLLASASAEEGAREIRKCQSCHNLEEGSGNKTGPALYDIVGRPIAEHGGFAYSDALIAYGEEHGNWDYTTLAAFIHNPREDVPGTKMTFAGIPDEADLANILAYLQTLSANPVAFPEPEPEVEASAEVSGETAEEMAAEAAAPAEDAVEVEAAVPAETDTDGAVEGSSTEEAVAVDETVAEEPAMEEPMAEEAVVEEPAAAEAVAEEPAMADGASALEAAIAAASMDDGASVMRKCRTCHDWSEGGRNKVGPILYDIVGHPIAAVEGYRYSDAMQAYGAENGTWSYALLDEYLANPRGVVPGTKMTFAGLNDAEDRAAAIAFLRAQSGAPLPLAGAE